MLDLGTFSGVGGAGAGGECGAGGEGTDRGTQGKRGRLRPRRIRPPLHHLSTLSLSLLPTGDLVTLSIEGAGAFGLAALLLYMQRVTTNSPMNGGGCERSAEMGECFFAMQRMSYRSQINSEGRSAVPRDCGGR